jgi:hypothetical protein
MTNRRVSCGTYLQPTQICRSGYKTYLLDKNMGTSIATLYHGMLNG